jgi:L-ascorbate 6-phosphate lactonase
MTTLSHQNLLKQMHSVEVPSGCLAIWGLGQMGLAIKAKTDQLIYIDPVLTNIVAETYPASAAKFERAFPAPLDPDEIDNAGLVLCTHEHLDHADPKTLAPIIKHNPSVSLAMPVPARESLSMILPEDHPSWQSISPEKPLHWQGASIVAIPAAHYDLDYSPEKGYRFFSYLIEWNGVRLFHSGDTLPYPGYMEALCKLPPIDVAMIACNGRDSMRENDNILGNLLPVEAVWYAKELDIDLLIPGHNDLYLYNTLPAGALADAIQQVNPRQKHCALQPGQLLMYIKP